MKVTGVHQCHILELKIKIKIFIFNGQTNAFHEVCIYKLSQSFLSVAHGEEEIDEIVRIASNAFEAVAS